MEEQAPRRYCLRFALFGIEIEIRLSIIILLAILGGALSLNSAEDFKGILIFIALGLLCLLCHELGHALAWRRLCGGSVRVELADLGGATSGDQQPSNRRDSILITAAGPLAGLLPALLAYVLLQGLLGNAPMARECLAACLPFREISPDCLVLLQNGIRSGQLNPQLLQALLEMAQISIVWFFFNILPVFPLDGGQLLLQFSGRPKLCFLLGLVLCLLLALLSIFQNSWFSAMVLGYLAFINLQILRSFRRGANNA